MGTAHDRLRRLGGTDLNAIAARRASPHAIWESIPLELIVSVLAVILAGGLQLAGIMP